MSTVRFPIRFVVRGLFIFFLGSTLASGALAQDRSVPRFGPITSPDTVQSGPFDLGRVWSLAQPPLDYFQETYGVQAGKKGLQHLRRGTVRLPGCSGTVVSPKGLVLTAAQCVRPFLTSRPNGSAHDGFVAEGQADEQSLSGLFAERVVEIETVTGLVEENGREAVQEQLQKATGTDQHVEVVSEAGGERFVAYTYRRHENVRLAFYPDRAVTLAGRLGQPLTYPQHAWEVAVLRLYDAAEKSTPLQTPNHLSIRESGVQPGDPVFALGHPAATRRGETHHQLALHRDLFLPTKRSLVSSWIESARQQTDHSGRETESAGRIPGAKINRNRLRRQMDALQDDYVMDRLRIRDRELVQSRGRETNTNGKSIMDRLGAIQREKRSYADRYRAFSFLLHPEYSSATLRRAVLVAQQQAGEIRSADSLKTALSAIPEQPPLMDAVLLKNHLNRLRKHLPADTALAQAMKNANRPASRVEGSIFSDSERLLAQLEDNQLPEENVLFRLGAIISDRYSDFQSDWETLTQKERGLTDSLARMRHQFADQPVALPEHRSPRITDGRIEGYSYNGTTAPPFTTFFGLYERHHALPADGSELPARWQTSGTSLERSTPLVTVASADPAGTGRGGPLVNETLELVGIVFDGNVQSAASEYLFLPARMRSAAVDTRGVIEGLSSVYGAEHLVQEMTREEASP